MSASRVLALWCMDWPAVAAATAAGLEPTAPVAVTLANRVVACSASARASGVRRGLRRREAQARCPYLHVVAADPARDARHFENVTVAVDDLVPRAEVLRPGLLVLPVRGAARYFGSEPAAAERLVDAVAAAGSECQVGIADQLPTAVFAARAGRIVEPGTDALFLSPLSIRQLATEPALAAPGREELADLLWRMGIRTLGQFAELSRTDVASRFGADAVAAHAFARGESARKPSGKDPAAELDAVMNCDPPIERVDAAAFAGRSLASALHRSLEGAGVGCTRLAIHAVTANGEELERVWRCAEPLTEDATADRVRWQLDGWLNRRTSEKPTAPVTVLRLRPVEVVSAAALQLPLWGGVGGEDRLRARRALVRVQGLLGPEAVQVPVLSGGRGPAERITLTPLGDEPVPRADPRQPWPGQLPEPSPTVLLDDPVELLDGQGVPVRVTSRGMFTADPARLAGAGRRDGSLRWWAGPWPVDERWWDPQSRGAGRTARAQVLLGDEANGLALLLCYRQRRWYLEGVYE
ncbi:DNA-directed DNA polymerase [Mycolicibacterium brisbanense]|uniref:DNA-directed DNA polymerase n=2 Tax=Mycolicibacterium brisbanense TaxID=146020 RepID=A0A124E094_9MYCO|nr:DNA-directed DNA polymerase [Mycolicibacterium brisbanense]